MKYHNTSSLGILELIQFSPFQPDADQLSLNELLPLAGYRKRTLTRDTYMKLECGCEVIKVSYHSIVLSYHSIVLFIPFM